MSTTSSQYTKIKTHVNKFNNVKFSNVPINPNVEFHFLLSFAIDYDTSGSSPTNGNFNVFWDTDNLGASQVSDIKNAHSNVKVGLSLGGDSVNSGSAYFNPSSVDSWVSNKYHPASTTVSQFINYYKQQSSNYNGGKVLASFSTDGSGRLSPENGFFTARHRLKSEQNLHGIFVWSADNSMKNGFRYEKQSQALLAIPQ
ncbi:hypothetical protein ACLB2K_063159 [Fragaria x ananassa]